MLPANLISALQVLSSSGKPLIPTAADTPNPVTKLEPGQQLQGHVQSKVSEGLFKVQVAGQTLQMRLPGNIHSGDTIRLQVTTLQPKVTFSMIASTNPLSTSEEIGAAARILSNLAEQPLERQAVQQLGNRAVWQSEQVAPNTKLLAGALRETLGRSGLFYESHQAQWIRGERSIHQLLEEPQNLLTGKHSLPPGTNQIQTEEMAKSSGDVPPPVAKELLHLVQQQLHALEHHHLVWAGQVWPGQEMQWEIQGEPEPEQQEQDERQWSTDIELTLPKLGAIHARMVFSESGLRLTLQATDPATVDLFNHALPQLEHSLAAASIALLAAAIEKS